MSAMRSHDSRRARVAAQGALTRGAAGLAVAALLVGGCAVGPDHAEPSPPAAAGYAPGKLFSATQSAAVAGGGAQRLSIGRDVPGEWWKLFRSKQIAALVAEAIENHPDIAAAEAALRQAREIAAADEGQFAPQASLSANITRQQGFSPAMMGGASGLSGGSAGTGSSGSTQFGGAFGAVSAGSTQLYTLYNTSVPVSFTPDVFGKNQRTVEADYAAADDQRFQLEAAYLALTANVVAAAIMDASYAEQIRVTRDLIAAYQEQADILQKRFELGAVSQADVLSERAQLAQAQATLPPLEKARAQTRNQLMAYVGRFPNQDKGEAVKLESLRLPSNLPLSLPSNLVRQRPDIRSAESRLHEASARIGVATANMLPQITLSASGGLMGFSLDKLLSKEIATYSLGASLTGQVFDGGALFHKREASLAAFEQSTEKYKSTVIAAFQNVADSLQAIQHDARTLHAQVLAESAAAQSLEVARIQFRMGSTTYWTVLNAEQTLLNARLNRVRAQAARYGDTVALFQALGGGWWNRVDETPAAQPKPTDLIAASPIAAAIRAGVEDSQKPPR